MSYRCLVCGYDQMPYPPKAFNICPCCGVEYGLDNVFDSYNDLRDEWLLGGGPWFSNIFPYLQPVNWNAWDQLDRAGYSYRVPRPEIDVKTENISKKIPQGVQLVRLLHDRAEWNQA